MAVVVFVLVTQVFGGDDASTEPNQVAAPGTTATVKTTKKTSTTKKKSTAPDAVPRGSTTVAVLNGTTTTGLAVLPMAFTKGAAAGAMNAIGTTVLGGMITGVLLVLLFAPLFYVLIAQVVDRRRPQPTVATA